MKDRVLGAPGAGGQATFPVRPRLTQENSPGRQSALSTVSPSSSRLITDSGQLRALASPPRSRPGIRRHFSSVYLYRTPAEVFDFFSNARNLEAITPPELNFHILTEGDIPMADGALIDYSLKLRGVTFKWRTRIARWDPPFGFVDEQVKGPYSIWHHTHSFTDEGDRVRMDDEVLYRLPLWPLGDVAAFWVDREVARIFEYRRRRILEIFGEE